MKELSDILAGFQSLCAENKPAALATVVAVCGSAYRRPGARMLIAADGRTWGGVSGGCLERDVAQRAQTIIGTISTLNCRYDTTDDENLSTGVATGCRGTVDIFIESISADSPGPIPWMKKVREERKAVILATVIRAPKGGPIAAGTRLEVSGACITPSPPYLGERAAVRDDHRECVAATETPHPSPLPCLQGRGRMLLAAIQSALEPTTIESRDPVIPIEIDGCLLDVFVERIEPPVSLMVFGGGPDVVPVVAIAKTLGWHVTVIAARPATRIHGRFAHADAVHVTSSDDPTHGVALRADDVIALMTHSFPRDLKILSALTFQPRYLGILGPRRRTVELLAELRSSGGIGFKDVHAPIGLDIGAQSPEAIALSIVAEIETVLKGGAAGFLRDRSGPIHARSVEISEPLPVDEMARDHRRGPACPS